MEIVKNFDAIACCFYLKRHTESSCDRLSKLLSQKGNNTLDFLSWLAVCFPLRNHARSFFSVTVSPSAFLVLVVLHRHLSSSSLLAVSDPVDAKLNFIAFL